MTSKEALKKAWDLVHDKYPENNDEIQLVRHAIKRAMELEELSTHMKVIKTQDWYYLCPNCKYEVDVSNVDFYCKQVYRYCYHCGQRLDWSGL